MSGLPKHLRPRYRYLAVELTSWPETDLRRSSVETAAKRSCRALLGDARTASIGPRVFTFRHSAGRGEAVMRVAREEVDAARSALACIRSIDGDPVGIRVRGVSGTVRGCEEKYLGSQREPIKQSQVAFDGAEHPAVQASDEVDIRVGDAYVGATPLDLE